MNGYLRMSGKVYCAAGRVGRSSLHDNNQDTVRKKKQVRKQKQTGNRLQKAKKEGRKKKKKKERKKEN